MIEDELEVRRIFYDEDKAQEYIVKKTILLHQIESVQEYDGGVEFKNDEEKCVIMSESELFTVIFSYVDMRNMWVSYRRQQRNLQSGLWKTVQRN